MTQSYHAGEAFTAARARSDTGTLFGSTMALIAVTTGLSTLGAYLGRQLSGGWGLAFWIASLACLMAMNVTVRHSERLTLGMVFGFGLLVGLAMAPTISYFANVYPEAVWEAGGATALFVAGFGAAGYARRGDLSALARVLLWALIAFGILLIFVSIPAGSVIYAVLGLAIFADLVMYDSSGCASGTRSTARRRSRPRSSSTSSTSSSPFSRCSAGRAVDG